MRRIFLLLLMAYMSIFSTIKAQKMSDFQTVFERNSNQSASYDEAITYYQSLAKAFDEINMIEAGPSDIGRPIHLVIISDNSITDIKDVDRSKKSILLINNAIHPGEPCGIDASMMLTRDLVANKSMSNLLKHTVIILIPVYNISGALNRSAYSRANQKGPEQYGFRGNIQHLDLNRDFIKTMSKNAQTFNQIFSKWMPDVMIDNHTSNGADYQYTMTLIPTQKGKLPPSLSSVLTEDFLPYLYQHMEEIKWPMTPYVYSKTTPEEGIAGFLDLARYSSGYAALHHCISFMPETHMLKPYKDRVYSTYDIMVTALSFLDIKGQKIRKAKSQAIDHYKLHAEFPINWQMDTSKKEKFLFKGYTAKYKKSDIHGQDRLYYDRDSPYEMDIDFWNSYAASQFAVKPKAYIIPQAYDEIITRLKNNNVHMSRLNVDSTFTVAMYYIDAFETSESAYEGRYLHSNISIKKQIKTRHFYKGDYIIELNQKSNRYILEMLEPNAPDSYFAWGFFDGILMQKEYFSPYVFEDLALEILADNPNIKIALENEKAINSDLKEDAYKQLEFIYKRSKYFEDSYKLYPIARIE